MKRFWLLIVPAVFLLSGWGFFIKQEQTAELPVSVRIGIMDSQEEILIAGTKENLTVIAGKDQFQSEPDKSWRLVKVESKPAKLQYLPVVKTVPEVKEYEVRDLVRTWEKKGYQVRVIKVGRRLQGKDISISNQAYWICLNPFDNAKEANAFCQESYQQGYKAWVYVELVKPAQGKMQLFDPQGRLKGTYEPPLSFISRQPIKVFQVEYGKGYYWAGKEDRCYQGTIEVNLDKDGNLEVIHQTDIEDYLCSIVPSEIEASSGTEALKAQAVAARGEVLAKFGLRHLADNYNFCADVHCQVHRGINRYATSTTLAVGETYGQVLMDNGQIVDTVYCGNCGGHTENNENVWASPPSAPLRGVPDFDISEINFKSPITQDSLKEWLMSFPNTYCSDAQSGNFEKEKEKFRWVKTYDAPELNRIVNKTEDVGQIENIVLLDRGVSGRLKAGKIIGSKKTVTVYKELPIREIFGGLRSAMFILEIKRDENNSPVSFKFIGGGWGHGVGMCQAGAKGMAKKGKNYIEILTHYFTGSQIKTIY